MTPATKRVRVLIAITDDGTYIAEGYSFTSPKKLIASLSESLHHYMTPPIEMYWLEADVLVPPPLRPRTYATEFIKLKGASRQQRRPAMTRKSKGARRGNA